MTTKKLQSDPNILLIPFSDIKVDYSFNVRQTYTDEKGQDTIMPLAEDICDNGLLTPLTVRPIGKAGKVELVAGFRRWKALEKIRNTDAPMLIDEEYANLVKVVPCLVKKIDPLEAALVNITENESRESIRTWELGAKCVSIQKAHKLSAAAIGKRLRYHKSHITLCINIANLPKPIVTDLLDGKANPSVKLLQDLCFKKEYKGETAAQTKALQTEAWSTYLGKDDESSGSEGDPPKKAAKKPSGNKVEKMHAMVVAWKKADQDDYTLDDLIAYQKALEWVMGTRKRALVADLDEGEEE